MHPMTLLTRFIYIAVCLCVVAHAAWGDPAAVGPREPAPLQLDDPIQPLVPLRRRSPADIDRIHAAALFSSGVMLQQDGDLSTALQKFQRAYRYDPAATNLIREIVPLAEQLGQHDVALRYALLVVENDPTEMTLLRSMAAYLTAQGDWSRAIGLYERWLSAHDGQRETAEHLTLWLELGRLYFLTEDFAKASQMFTALEDALTRLDNGHRDGGHRDGGHRDGGHRDGGHRDGKTNQPGLEDPGLSYQLFGECHLLAGRLQRARDSFEKAYRSRQRLDPPSSRGRRGYNLARVAAREKKPIMALQLLTPYFDARLKSEGTTPYELLVQILHDLNQSEEIEPRLEALRKNDPQNIPLQFALAQFYSDQRKFDQARPILQALRQESGADIPTEAARALLRIYRLQRDPQNIAHLLGRVVRATGSLQVAVREVNAIAGEADLVDALLGMQREQLAAEAGGLSAEELVGTAQVALAAGRFEAAEEFFNLAIKTKQEIAARLLLEWGLTLFVKEQFSSAADVFRRRIDLKTGSQKQTAADYYYLAGALELDDQTDAALEAAHRSAELMPDSALFASRGAWIQYHAERYEEARKSYEELIRKFGNRNSGDGNSGEEGRVRDSSEVRETLREARLTLSHLCVLRNDLADAEEWLEQVLDEFPQNAGAMNDLGFLWVDQNRRLQPSLKMIQYAVAAEPDNVAYRDSLGWAFYRLGRYQDAIRELKLAAQGESPDPIILDHLGDAYQKLSQVDKATAAWSQSLELFLNQDNTVESEKVKAKLER